jgi:hypothetical protein
VIPTLPLRPRNRLAELVLGAVSDGHARAELLDLAAASTLPPGWLSEEDTRHTPALLARARAAARVFERRPVALHPLSCDETLDVAAALFDAALYFEVHEILEPWWHDATGAAREALQGLIQIAVGYQHFANGNLPGAKALLAEGSARLAAGRLSSLDLETFALGVRASLGAGDVAVPASVPRFPRIPRAA